MADPWCHAEQGWQAKLWDAIALSPQGLGGVCVCVLGQLSGVRAVCRAVLRAAKDLLNFAEGSAWLLGLSAGTGGSRCLHLQ